MQWSEHIAREIKWNDLELLQRSLVNNVSSNDNMGGHLLFSEPTPTYTAGKSATESDFFITNEYLCALGAEKYPVSRGGKWTFHGPGQLLLYPIVQLKAFGLSSKESKVFVDTLKEATLEFLHELNIPALFHEEPYGIYVGNKKLVSFGLDFKQGVAKHGLALYLTPQQKWFSYITPCGTPGQLFTSLEEEGVYLNWSDAASQLASNVKLHFARLVEKR